MQAQVTVSRVDPTRVVPRRGARQHTNPFVEKKAHRRQRSLTRALAHVQVPLSPPYPEFNQAAKKAAVQDEFEPATRNGEPIPYSLKCTISFRLKDE
jgi:hypothetical protein